MDEHERLIQLLLDKITSLEEKIDAHIKDEAVDRGKLSELYEAWQTAGGVMKLLKITSGLIAAAAATWAFVSGHFTIGIK